MNQDLQNFNILLEKDTKLQEKVKSAAENYGGEKTQKAIYTNVLIPIAEEAGFHFTWEDIQEYALQISSSIQDLNGDEMDQVAGAGVTSSIENDDDWDRKNCPCIGHPYCHTAAW